MRLLGRLMVWPVLLACCVLVLLPFTVSGSRWLLTQLNHLDALSVEYAGGTLAGDLALHRLTWADETIRLELNEVSARLDRACLWRSAVCLEALQAASLTIELLSADADEQALDSQPAQRDSGDDELLVFPFVIEVPRLELAALGVHWQGGAWRQGKLSGSVSLSGSTIAVGRASVENALLELAASGSGQDGPLILPDIDLPLELQVEELVLQGAAWDTYGSSGELQNLRLAGSWRNSSLQVRQLQVKSATLGELAAVGELDFSGQWPLSFKLDAFATEFDGWPAALGRHLVLAASGSVGALELALDIDGATVLTGHGRIDPLDPVMPFQLAAELQWEGQLLLSEQASLPEQLHGVALQAPLVLAATGTLLEQGFQLEATGSAPGYDALTLHLGGRHEDGLLVLDDLRLADRASEADLWGAGELRYGQRLQWALALESSGLTLPPLQGGIGGEIQGRLKVSGWLADQDWELALSEVDLQGQLNALPATINGYAGLGSDLGLLASALDADLNGARMSLRAAPGGAAPGRLELEVDDLARWLPHSSGRVSLAAVLARNWQSAQLQGSLAGFQWEGFEAKAGVLDGSYDAGSGAFRLDLSVSELEFGAMELERLGLNVSGDHTAQDIVLRSSGDVEGALELSGALDGAGDWRGQLASTSLQTAEGTWHLSQDVALHFKPEIVRLQVEAHCWHYQRSRLCPGDIVLGEEGSASFEIAGGLDALSAFLPAYIVASGQLDARLAAQWRPGSRTQINGELHGQDLQLTRHFSSDESGTASLQTLSAKIETSDAGLDLTAGLYIDDTESIALALRLPTEREQELDGKLTLTRLELATLAPFMPTLSALAGELDGSVQLGGTFEQPLARGGVALTGGRLAMLGNPTELENLDLELIAEGDSFRVKGQGLLGGGPLDITGTLAARPDWQLELALSGDRHELLLPPYTQALVSERLKLSYGKDLLELTGTINIHEGTLEHEQLPAGSVDLSSDVVEVDVNGNVLSQDRALPIRMNIAVVLEDRFMLVGDMVNATLGGDLQLVQEPGKPLQLFGNLNVIGGELRAYQQHLRIKRGTISFSGPPQNPELQVRAQREISTEQVVVGIELLGTLEQPRLDIFSEPAMSQANTMSYLIRGRSVDTGASADGAAMALSLGTGVVNQSELVAELNRIPGISNLAFGAEGTADDTAATVGGYIGERLYLSYGLGIYEPINVLTARLYLQTRLWLEVVSRLENSVDLYYSFDIK